jgi:hypothetical protein
MGYGSTDLRLDISTEKTKFNYCNTVDLSIHVQKENVSLIILQKLYLIKIYV